jgi:hypothetical protein
MTSKITIFDHFQKPLVELSNIPTTPRSWVENAYGKCEFAISTDDPACKPQYLQFGNLIHIEHIAGVDADGNTLGKLPSWVGILLPPQSWDKGLIRLTGYSAEAILDFRSMPYISVDNTPANIFKRILELSRKIYTNIIINFGITDDLGQMYQDDFKLSGYAHIKKLVDNNRMDWDVTGFIDDAGNLQLQGNLYREKGRLVNYTLTETNTELTSPYLTVQGTPSNVVHGFSQAQTQNSRRGAIGINQTALDIYGPLELNKVFMGTKDEAAVKTAAQAWADENGKPVTRVNRNVLNVGKAFDYMEVGNVLPIRERAGVGFLPRGGFGIDGVVRVIAVSYNDLTDKVPLSVDVNPPLQTIGVDVGASI